VSYIVESAALGDDSYIGDWGPLLAQIRAKLANPSGSVLVKRPAPEARAPLPPPDPSTRR
jgi:hypothetical protein